MASRASGWAAAKPGGVIYGYMHFYRLCKTYEYVQNEQSRVRKSRSNQSAAKDGSLSQKDKGYGSRGAPIGFAGFVARS
jgi:hypothetical protein